MIKVFLLKDVTTDKYFGGFNHHEWQYEFSKDTEKAIRFSTYLDAETATKKYFEHNYESERMFAVEGVFIYTEGDYKEPE